MAIGDGENNKASGKAPVVIGCSGNVASGDNSIALGKEVFAGD